MMPTIRYILLPILLSRPALPLAAEPISIVWIVIEDASPHIGCYGETAIETPHMDQMATDGTRCNNAFVTTAVFLWTDHGVSHLRGKQFLYEEGIRVPLMVRLPWNQRAGTVREDLIEHIDITAASLKLARIPIPPHVQGRDFLATDYTPRDHLFAGRDRCDETVDILRCIRDSRYKYIRSFMSYAPHAQPNQYKDGKKVLQTLRGLHTAGKLNELQSRPFMPRRPPEELYDLQNDPYETVNLATDPRQVKQLADMREVLYSRMTMQRVVGLIPEPILEDIGREAGSKSDAFRIADHSEQTRHLITIITAGEANDAKALLAFAESEDPPARYWAAAWLGVNQTVAAKAVFERLAADPSPTVGAAAAQALCKLGDSAKLALRVEHINDPNLLVGMFALRAIEELGDSGKVHQAEIAAAQKSEYEFSRRIATRLTE